MSAEGRLGDGGGAELLAACWDQGRTGVLELDTAGVERRLVLRAGDVVYVTSSEKREKLPIRLMAKGLVSRDALVAASKSSEDLRAGLEAAGALGADAHDAELRALVAEVVGAVFEQTEGKWTLVDKADLDLPGLLEKNPMRTLLWRRAREASPEFAAGFLGDTAQRLQRHGGDEDLADLEGITPQEFYLVSRIDGYSSVEDVLGAAPVPREDALRLLLGLSLLGLVDSAGRRSLQLPRPGKGSGAKPRAKPKPKAAPASSQAPATARADATAGAAAAAEGAAAGVEDPLALARDLTARMAEMDHFELLSVARDADAEAVRRAYYRLARHLHPDRFPKDAPEREREKVEELFGRIGEAFSVLSDPKKRKAYEEALKSGEIEREKKAQQVDPRELAEQSFKKGLALIAGGDAPKGLRYLSHAVDADPTNVEHRLAYARALASQSRTRRQAEKHLLEVIRLDPAQVEAYYRLGVIYAGAGLKQRAIEQLEAGAKWDPEHAGIQKELAALRDTEAEGGGLLGGLFGKKK